MTHVVTLVSNPAAPALTEAVLARAAAALPGASAPHWLNPGIAADLFLTPTGVADNRALAETLRAALGERTAQWLLRCALGVGDEHRFLVLVVPLEDESRARHVLL